MKIFFSEGRLGNQIFQYVFLKSNKSSGERIVVCGFDNLLEVFEISDIVHLSRFNRILYQLVIRIFKPCLELLSKFRIISSIQVNEIEFNGYPIEDSDFSLRKGLLSKLTYVKLGFFQSETFFLPQVADQLKIKSKHIEHAKKALSDVPSDANLVCIHIRRADYTSFKVFGKSTLVPLSYYKSQINWFLDNRKNCYFIFLSDEPEWARKEFTYLENKLIFNDNHYGVDFTILTLCNSAILSPSSFGWWGSYFMRNRDVVFVPKYWLGFNSCVDAGTHPLPSYATEVVIPPENNSILIRNSIS